MVELFDSRDPRRYIFEHYKKIQSNLPSKLALNYSDERFNLDEQEILTYFKKSPTQDPTIFSTVYRREWWPEGSYRILNRTWQYPRVTVVQKTINDGLYEMVSEQISWCKKQPNFRIAIITRNKNKRLFFKMIKDLKKINLDFFIGENIWVCEGTALDCYQHVLYYGDKSVLKEWNKPCR